MNPFKIDLSNKVAVVTGGGGVLCSAFAKSLSEAGAKVAVLDLRKEFADKVVDDINKNGDTAISIVANVLELESLENAKKEVTESLGKCDILINGAGGNHPKGSTSNDFLELSDISKEGIKTFYDLDPEGIKFVFDLNFLGTLLPSQVFSKDMIDGKSGVIVNVSSMNAFTPLTRIPAYSAAKSAVSNFTQ